MRSWTLAWAAALPVLSTTPGLGQQVKPDSQPQGIACAYNSTLPAIADKGAGWIQCDSSGRLIIANPGGGSGGGSGADQTGTNATDGQATRSDNQHTLSFGYIYNGTTWDRARGANGIAFTSDSNLTQVIAAPGASSPKALAFQRPDGKPLLTALDAITPVATSYQLLANASATGTAVTANGGNYLLDLRGTFGGATVSIVATVNGNAATLGTYTATPTTTPQFTIATGTSIQAVVSGGTPSGLNATLGGIGPGGTASAAVAANPGVGADTAVPAGTTAGVALGTMPANAKGARMYMNPGDAITYAVQPSCGTTPNIKHVAAQPSSAPGFTNIDENLNGQMVCVISTAGSPSFRWF